MAGPARHDQGWRRTWVGLALVIALLAHDALMAVAAHAEPAIPVRFSHHHVSPDRSSRTAGAGVDLAVDHAPFAPGEVDDCGQTRPALPTGDHPVVEGDAPAVSVAIAGIGQLRSAERWSEPTWPPGKRRALTQVYRV